MMDTLHRLWNEHPAQTRGAAVVMCDIDDFKKLNDGLGHAEGDRCLVKVAGIVQSSMREERDQVARYGAKGSWFFSRALMNRKHKWLPRGYEATWKPHLLQTRPSRVVPYVTVSIGVATVTKDASAVSAEELQRQADAALYVTKRAGRNRVAVYDSSWTNLLSKQSACSGHTVFIFGGRSS